MIDQWLPKETTTHQDHVIAHVIGATVVGYFVFDEALHLLLDIGFAWTIYLDGQMMLLPQSLAVNELEADAETRSEIAGELDRLTREGRLIQDLKHITPVPVDCVIKEVDFFADGERRQLILTGEDANLAIETSLETAEISVRAIAE
jgi:hypothetical protein